MSLGTFQRIPGGRRLLWRLAGWRARTTAEYVRRHIHPGETLLDVGAGICDISLRLQQFGGHVTALDVADYSCTPLLRPLLYDGLHMPFRDGQFDTALLLTVLHHIPAGQQEAVLREAARVAQRLIIIEDVYRSDLHRRVTQAMDSLLNLEFRGHPHSNRPDAEWRALFVRLGWYITAWQPLRSFVVLRHRLYVLECKNESPAVKPMAARTKASALKPKPKPGSRSKLGQKSGATI